MRTEYIEVNRDIIHCIDSQVDLVLSYCENLQLIPVAMTQEVKQLSPPSGRLMVLPDSWSLHVERTFNPKLFPET